MQFLYLDESGTHAKARHFVVAGFAISERRTYHMANEFDELQRQHFPDAEGTVEFHASALLAPQNRVIAPYSNLTFSERLGVISDVYDIICRYGVRLFAAVIEKEVAVGDPYEQGFEQVVSRFDMSLARLNQNTGQSERGLVVVAESGYRENLELLAEKIRTQGHSWGSLHNMADIPYFAPAKSTRLLQATDFISNAVYSKYETGYGSNFDRLMPKFDQEAGRVHGLVHFNAKPWDCYCPACMSRRPGGIGSSGGVVE